MDDKIIESYLDNIAELVVDEDKIVTYKSLSRSLGIHVNTAKQLLYTYLTQQKAENVFPISATYLLAGKLEDGSFNITVINESELESTYSKFTEITSEHIYSIQKSKNGVKEINILCGVDKGAQESTSLVITSSKCVLKSKDEVKKKQESNNQENKEAIKKAFGAEKVCLQESNKKVESPVKTDIVKVSPKKQKEKTQANIKKAGGNIANMFAKAAQKQAEKPKNNKSEENEQRVLNSDKEEDDKSEKDKSVLNISAKTGQKNTEGVENVLGNADSLSDEEFEILKSKKSKKTTPNASLIKKKGSKRKRICMDSDSNDSSSDDGKPSQTPIEEDDSKSQPATPVFEDDDDPTESQPLNKRKKRKIVDKTIILKDGYLETNKEVVFVTDSDDDDEEPKKDKKSKPTAKPKPAFMNAAKKQSSLLTFFKKS